MTLGIYGEVVFDLFYQLVSSLDLFYFSMDLASILSEEELLALLVSIDEKLEKVDSFKRVHARFFVSHPCQGSDSFSEHRSLFYAA